MKTITFITLSLFYFSVCGSQVPVQMTSQEQENAKKQIREAVKVILQNLEKMDANALFQSYSDAFPLIFHY